MILEIETNHLDLDEDKNLDADENHIHFLLQSVPMYSPQKIIQTMKSIIAKEVFKNNVEVKKWLWGGEFWTDGYYVNSVGGYGNIESVMKYIEKQGKGYKRFHRNLPKQGKLFEL